MNAAAEIYRSKQTCSIASKNRDNVGALWEIPIVMVERRKHGRLVWHGD